MNSDGDNERTSFELLPEIGYRLNDKWTVGGVGFAFAKAESTIVSASEDYTLFEIGFKPGLAIPVTGNLSFVGYVGFLGYRDNDGLSTQDNGFCLNVGGNDVSFGIYYSF